MILHAGGADVVHEPRLSEMNSFFSHSVKSSIHIVSIRPDGKPTARWFGEFCADACKWSQEKNLAGSNVYWTVNQVRAGLNSKPRKSDIIAARFAHVDIDPPKDNAVFDRNKVLDRLKDAAVPPSFVIDSGNGVQAFWRLIEGIALHEVEELNRGLASQFDGDHCHNIDRLMRLPGTINYPTAAKKARGRIVTQASLVKADDGKMAPWEGLIDMVPTAAKEKPLSKASIPLEIQEFETLETLNIAQGDRLFERITAPDGGDRSVETLAVACEMVRRPYSNQSICGILLNPAYAISAHCLSQPDPKRAAERAIEKARQSVASELNFDAFIPAGHIAATPYVWMPAHKIPQRRWIYGRQLLRDTLALMVAPGATGKTAMLVGTALALVTGKPLLGKDICAGPQRVWFWNLEDSCEELTRLIQAASQHWGLSEDDIGGRLFVDSGLEGAELCMAVEDRRGFRIVKPVMDALVAELRARRIDVIIIDPFVSCHRVSENDNGAIDAVAKAWARVAKDANCTVYLAHHTAKTAGAEVTAEKARGAVALVNAARSVLALNKMTVDEATRLGVGGEERRRFFRAYDDKNNRAPPADVSDWYRLESVPLHNGAEPFDDGDNVQVVVPWCPPVPIDGVDTDDLRKVQCVIDQGQWRLAKQAGHRWAAFAVGQALGFDVESADGNRRASQLLKSWLKSGALRVQDQHDDHRKLRPCVVVGRWAEPSCRGDEADESPDAKLRQSSASSKPTGATGAEGPKLVRQSSLSPLGETGTGASSVPRLSKNDNELVVQKNASSSDPHQTGGRGVRYAYGSHPPLDGSDLI